MNADELKKAREICNKATEGPWKQTNGGYDAYAIKIPAAHDTASRLVVARCMEGDSRAYCNAYKEACNDAEFIAFARTALPAALDEIERLQKENAIMSEALEKLSRLGAGDRLGNSDGNCIAQRALKEAKGDK